jgi:hypothetical protein
MASTANFAATPKSPSVLISAANTNRDGTTGTYGTVMTAGAGGSRIDRLNITATGITTAGMVRLFLGNALIEEIPVQAQTPNATTPAWSADVVFDNGLILQASAVLKASTNNAEAFNVTVISGGDF